MELTKQAPNVPVSQFKRSKIIATVGPATDSYEMILALIKAGANGLRLNFSHGTHEERAQQIKWIRRASKEYGKPVAIIADMQGPKIRLGDFEGFINVQTGQSLVFEYGADYEKSGHIPTQYDLSQKVKRGERVYLYDGKVRTTVTSIKDNLVHVRVENDGILLKRKGMNLPDTNFGGDVITPKDRKDLAFCSMHDIDYVAQSFVQTADDIRNLRKIMRNLNMDAKIITKFETRVAIEHMEAIVQETDVIMVARGDLAIEAQAETVPIIQRQLIGLGMKYAKPTIVATHMLFSMTETPEPTRAEVSDVATAVIIGADGVMLSDETANGRYPLEAVMMMKNIVLYAQENSPLRVTYPEYEDREATKNNAISNAVMTLADQMGAKAIVAETKSGATALMVASKRPVRPIIVVTSSLRVAQQLAIVYGVKSYVRRDSPTQTQKLTEWLRENKVFEKGDVIVSCSGRYPGVVGTTDTIKIRVLE